MSADASALRELAGPCPLCGDSGYAETYHGGVWTGEGVFSTYDICDCSCGDDVRREQRAQASMQAEPEGGRG
jgi:hypothetical protein